MTTPLHVALQNLHEAIEKKNRIHILHTSELSRVDREILVANHWLEEIIPGWYLVVRPDLTPGDTTAWYANFWDFLSLYLQNLYEKNYCLSAEISLDLHVGATHIPEQVIVVSHAGSGKPVNLPFNTSLLVYADPERLPVKRSVIKDLQVMTFEYALCRVPPSYFLKNKREAEIALQSINDPTELIRTIVEFQFKAAAGRIIGAYRFLDNTMMADRITTALKSIGFTIQETNPFKEEPLIRGRGFRSPYVARVHAMWKEFRSVVIDNFPAAPGLPADSGEYLQRVNTVYAQDAYNSLSIEGYQVTKELIEKVKRAEWNPDGNDEDKQKQNTLAARGYYEAFQQVKESIIKIISGQSPGLVIEQDLQLWFQKLFGPSVRAGILTPVELFGYRRHQIYIRNSRHTPPSSDYLGEIMMAFFQCMQEEENAAVRAIVGHFLFVFIHPYMDGNGRIGRFLMNAMFASGGYPWTIIHVEHRSQYFRALESASVEANILPFAQFILSEMTRTHTKSS
ncbi:MAG: Fic family protein [Verrucomicrobia bacterium]|nr:Fic family protein [Verrucomicrobiota bacterium]MBS0637630.1 Fic family protein [Verrucomicrobiota bacterium]